jgi:hypothetical protein
VHRRARAATNWAQAEILVFLEMVGPQLVSDAVFFTEPFTQIYDFAPV